jgi:dolichol-phosphate mannosyltransferase
MPPDVSVIVPVYNEEPHNLTALIHEIKRVFDLISVSYELVFVDDGGRIETNLVLRDLVKTYSNIKLIVLSRNFGEQAAICAGLSHASGLVSVNLDSDLQDPPEHIIKMLEAWQQGYDIVLAKQSIRHEPLSKTLPSSIFYRVLNFMADRHIPVDVGEFRLLSRPVIDTLNQMPERVRFMRELVPWVGFKQIEIPFERADRESGTSGYTLGKLLSLALQAMLVSSTKPLLLILPMAATLLGLGIIAFVAATFLPFTWQPSNAQIAALNLIFCALLALILGVVAPYIARIVGEVRARPLFIVSELVGFNVEIPQRKKLLETGNVYNGPNASNTNNLVVQNKRSFSGLEPSERQ